MTHEWSVSRWRQYHRKISSNQVGLSERRTKLLPRYRKFTLNHEKSSTSHTPTPLEPHQSNGMVPRVPSLNTERRSVKKNFRQINASGIVPGSCLVGLDESRTTYCHEFKKKLRQIIADVVGAPSNRMESWSHAGRKITPNQRT